MELRAENVSRRYMRQGKGTNFFLAVKDAGITVSAGKLTEITGRSGSGKSTLLNILGGLLAPTTGNVYLTDSNAQTDIYALNDNERSRLRNRHIGMIPQGQTGLHSLTVKENIQLPALMYGENSITDERAAQLMERVGILPLMNVYPNELSGGEMRRLAIARALAMQPEILLADEPTGDLDDENTKEVLTLLRSCADEGMAVLLVTHELEAAAYADLHYRMRDGVLES